MPKGLSVAEVDFDDHASLVSALKGHDALIISLSVTAPRDTQSKLVKASAEANIKWIMPNEYGVNASDESIANDTMIGIGARHVRKEIEQAGLSWVSLTCSFWLEWSLANGPLGYAIDIPSKTVLFFDDGKTKISTSTWPQCGRAIAALFALKISPDGPADKSLCLDNYRNKPCFIESFNISQRDMLDAVERVTETTDKDYVINSIAPEKRWQHAKDIMQKGVFFGFNKALYSRLVTSPLPITDF